MALKNLSAAKMPQPQIFGGYKTVKTEEPKRAISPFRQMIV